MRLVDGPLYLSFLSGTLFDSTGRSVFRISGAYLVRTDIWMSALDGGGQ